MEKKNLHLSGFESQTDHSEVCRYTDYAIAAPPAQMEDPKLDKTKLFD